MLEAEAKDSVAMHGAGGIIESWDCGAISESSTCSTSENYET